MLDGLRTEVGVEQYRPRSDSFRIRCKRERLGCSYRPPVALGVRGGLSSAELHDRFVYLFGSLREGAFPTVPDGSERKTNLLSFAAQAVNDDPEHGTSSVADPSRGDRCDVRPPDREKDDRAICLPRREGEPYWIRRNNE
jgi:hypothetical protein